MKSPSIGSSAAPCRRTDGQTGVTKLISTFNSFANSTNNGTKNENSVLENWA